MPKNNLADFLGRLAADTVLRERYLTDSESVATEAGLSVHDQAVLRSGDADRIAVYLGGMPATGTPIVKAPIVKSPLAQAMISAAAKPKKRSWAAA